MKRLQNASLSDSPVTDLIHEHVKSQHRVRPLLVAHLLMSADKPQRLRRTAASATVEREKEEVSVNRWQWKS